MGRFTAPAVSWSAFRAGAGDVCMGTPRDRGRAAGTHYTEGVSRVAGRVPGCHGCQGDTLFWQDWHPMARLAPDTRWQDWHPMARLAPDGKTGPQWHTNQDRIDYLGHPRRINMRHVMVCLIVVAALSGHLTAVRADPEDDLLKKFQKQNQPAALGSSAPVKPPANLQKASASQAIALPKPAVESFAGAGSDAKTSLG